MNVIKVLQCSSVGGVPTDPCGLAETLPPPTALPCWLECASRARVAAIINSWRGTNEDLAHGAEQESGCGGTARGRFGRLPAEPGPAQCRPVQRSAVQCRGGRCGRGGHPFFG